MSSKEKIHRRSIFRDLIPMIEYLPPDGGWGYMVTLATSSLFIFAIVPFSVFGILFGEFLAIIGDETRGTSLANGILYTVLNFTGLLANHLLQKMSPRKVGLIGAFVFFSGAFLTIFVNSLWYLLITFGVLQGLGVGLMLPACFTALNSYFEKKKSLMMNLNQVLVVALTILWPALTVILKTEFGFRGTLAIFAALGLNCVLAMTALQPVRWHMIKKKVFRKDVEIVNEDSGSRKSSLKEEAEENLLPQVELVETRKGSFLVAKPRPSIISLGNLAASVGSNLHKTKDPNLSKWQALVRSLDLDLFKDPKYLNVSSGLSLSFLADTYFISLLPLLLHGYGYNKEVVTEIMTIFFISDLASRIFITLLSAFTTYKNRIVFLVGSAMNFIFRIAFLFNTDSYWWLATIAAFLGFFRCFIQTPLPMVIAEEYSHRFSSAFSLYMVVCGLVSLIMGPLFAFIKSVTGSDIIVIYAIAGANLICTVFWIAEIVFVRISSKQNKPSGS